MAGPTLLLFWSNHTVYSFFFLLSYFLLIFHQNQFKRINRNHQQKKKTSNFFSILAKHSPLLNDSGLSMLLILCNSTETVNYFIFRLYFEQICSSMGRRTTKKIILKKSYWKLWKIALCARPMKKKYDGCGAVERVKEKKIVKWFMGRSGRKHFKYCESLTINKLQSQPSHEIIIGTHQFH